MAKKKEVLYTVTGTGPFPIDMLRYDCVHPATQGSADRVVAALDPERTYLEHRAVVVRGKHCTAARWESFGWKVLGTVDKV